MKSAFDLPHLPYILQKVIIKLKINIQCIKATKLNKIQTSEIIMGVSLVNQTQDILCWVCQSEVADTIAGQGILTTWQLRILSILSIGTYFLALTTLDRYKGKDSIH